MIIGVDIGNTQLKWQVYGQPDIYSSNTIDGLISGVGDLKLERVVCCSVRGVEFDRRFSSLMFEATGIEVEFYYAEASFGVVTCAYGDDYSRLGADRWMAVLAAAKRHEPYVAVIDIGTAITIDIVDGDLRHAGGYIVPGFSTLIAAINSRTKLIEIEPDYESEYYSLGSSTDLCVNRGCINMVVGFIDGVLDRYPGVVAVYCGGGYEMIKNYLRNKGLYQNSLVLDGLFERSVEQSLKI